MSADSVTFPPPNNPDDFESLCLDLWKEIWGDPGAQKNGRSGQAQAGVDVFGKAGGRWIGVQCKQKSGLLRTRVTVGQLEEEVEKAYEFVPKLASFILATSGERDAKVQTRARQITERHRERGLFEVEVWSWMDIWQEIYGRTELFRRILPIYWPGVSHAPTQLADFRARLQEAAEKISRWGQKLEKEARGQGVRTQIETCLAELAELASELDELLGAGTLQPLIDAQKSPLKEQLDGGRRAMQEVAESLLPLADAEWVSVSAKQLERQLEPFRALKRALEKNPLLVG